MPIRAVSIDAHGTMILPHPGVGPVYAQIAAAHGLAVDAAAVERAFPAAFAGIRRQWAVPYGADEDDARRFWTAVIGVAFAACNLPRLPHGMADDLYDAFAEARHWRILPGVQDALDLVHERRLPLVVVSNFDGRLRRILAGHGLGPFAGIVISAEIGAAKPDPRPLLAAAAIAGVDATEILHIGDSASEDGGMCAAAGCRWHAVDGSSGIDCMRLAEALAGY